jgi:hypothetical protein
LAAASQPWSHRNAQQWTAEDVNQILLASPWAQQAGVTFAITADDEVAPPERLPSAADAGLAGHGQPDTRWDGGVGRPDRYNTPTLNVTVRWDSALPERLAAQKAANGNAARLVPYSDQKAAKYYIVTVIGLVPGGGYGTAGRADKEPARDDSREPGTSMDKPSPEQMLRMLIENSRLFTRSFDIPAEDAKLDTSTGTLHIFFPRGRPITLDDKEVVLKTRFGSVSLTKKFRLKEMMYAGRLEL